MCAKVVRLVACHWACDQRARSPLCRPLHTSQHSALFDRTGLQAPLPQAEGGELEQGSLLQVPRRSLSASKTDFVEAGSHLAIFVPLGHPRLISKPTKQLKAVSKQFRPGNGRSDAAAAPAVRTPGGGEEGAFASFLVQQTLERQ